MPGTAYDCEVLFLNLVGVQFTREPRVILPGVEGWTQQ